MKIILPGIDKQHDATIFLHKALCMKRMPHSMSLIDYGYFDEFHGMARVVSALELTIHGDMDVEEDLKPLAQQAGAKMKDVDADFIHIHHGTGYSHMTEVLTLKSYSISTSKETPDE